MSRPLGPTKAGTWAKKGSPGKKNNALGAVPRSVAAGNRQGARRDGRREGAARPVELLNLYPTLVVSAASPAEEKNLKGHQALAPAL